MATIKTKAQLQKELETLRACFVHEVKERERLAARVYRLSNRLDRVEKAACHDE